MVGLVPAPQAPISAPAALSKPTKPLLRRSTLSGTVRKVDDTDLDSHLLTSTPPSPNKKSRVTFNLDVEEKVLVGYKGRSVETIQIEVRRAIDGRMKGDNEAYDALKEVFGPSKSSDDADEELEGERRVEIKTYVVALTKYTSLLNSQCSGLVKAIVWCDWIGRDSAFVKAYVHFLGSLVSAQGSYVAMVLGMLVDSFTGVRLSSGRLTGYSDVNRNQLSSRIHVALGYLLKLIPSASSRLPHILAHSFPLAEDSRKKHVTFISNLVRLIGYAPELKSEVFALITDRLVKIDVQMQRDLDDIDDEVTAAIVQAITLSPQAAEDDAEDSDSDAESVVDDDGFNSEAKQIKDVQTNVEKMDAILDLLFTIYTPYFTDPDSIEAASMFETLLSQFANIVLPTYRSRHTQFLLFHFAQTAEHLIDQFAGTCVQLAFDPSRPAVLKQSAAAYLASFVARGSHVQPHTVRTVFELIGNNLEHIQSENELTCRGPNLKRYTTFYALTQALLYIFCFRWRDLITSSEVLEDDDPTAFLNQDLEWTPGIKEMLHNVIYSKLNPLKICSPPIVAQFAQIANHLRFMYIYPLLETNKRVRLSQFAPVGVDGPLRDTGGGRKESWHQLDAYFPFDPYQLPLSKKWVEADYVLWKGVPGLNNQDDEDEDESVDEDDDDDVDVNDDDTATDGDDE